MGRKCLLAIIIVFAMMVVGCNQCQITESYPAKDRETVPNIFDGQASAPPDGTTSVDVTAKNESTTDETIKRSEVGSMSHGCSKSVVKDEKGSFLVYDGGDLKVTYTINASGLFDEEGVGILIFVDGQPQPYKTSSNDEYRYLHVFYPTDNVEMTEDFYFIPVTGEAGDTLEIWFANINYPYYSLTNGMRGFAYTSGSVRVGTRLVMNSSAQDTISVDVQDRVNAVSVTHVDLTSAETSEWTSAQWQERYEYRMYVNGSQSIYIYNTKEEDPVKLRFEVWGNPYVHYGLVFFIDNEPVSISEEDRIYFGVNSGQKTVVEVELDMSGFDGECVVYAALVPRNWRTADVLTSNWLDMSQTFYLLDGDQQ